MKTIILFTAVLSLGAHAQSIAPFIHGLKSDLLFNNTQRAEELEHRVRLAEFGWLSRVMSPDATATYNSRLNTISLHKDLLDFSASPVKIKDARVIRGPQFMTVPLQTIFHELGHAELDTMIENKLETEDLMVMNHYKYFLENFYKKNFPQMDSFDLFHEHFSYYRTDLIEFMYAEQDQIFLDNGFNKFQKRCWLTPDLKKLLKQGISREEFSKFIDVFNRPDEFYRKKIQPSFVYVRGKDFDLRNPRFNKEVVARTHDIFWAYHQHFYQFAMNRKDYLKRLNARSAFRKTLAECRDKFWLEHR